MLSKHHQVIANSPSHHLCFQCNYISCVIHKLFFFFIIKIYNLTFRSVSYRNLLLFPPTTIIKIPPCAGLLPSGSFLDNMQRFVQLSHHKKWKGTHLSSENAMDGTQNGGMLKREGSRKIALNCNTCIQMI